MKNGKLFFIAATVFVFVVLLSRCVSNEKKEVVINNKGQAFAGSATCKTCHQAIYDSFVRTAHYADSRPATKEAVKGSFARGANSYLYNFNVNRVVAMEERNDGLYQVAYINKQPAEAHRFDIVIGSGRKGQSYLSWQNNHLFQLPISYFTPDNAWINSPGYPSSDVKFNRAVQGRCLECHSTFAKETNAGAPGFTPAQFNKAQIMYGIDCERCHGAAAAHVQFHTQHPEAKKGVYISNPAGLSRQQRLDACALCHSGLGESVKPAFSYSVGDTLSKYYTYDHDAATNATLDVHGNQYGLLKASKCFMLSGTMDCSSCHNTHQKQNSAAAFSQKCMTCHTEATHNFCKMAAAIGPSIKNNCIDCHMPVQDSKTLAIGNPKLEDVTAAKVRSHLIAVYDDATKKYLETIKQH